MFKITLYKPGLLDKRVVFPVNPDTRKEAEVMASELVGREYGGVGIILLFTGQDTYHVFHLNRPDAVVTIEEYPEGEENHDGIEYRKGESIG